MQLDGCVDMLPNNNLPSGPAISRQTNLYTLNLWLIAMKIDSLRLIYIDHEQRNCLLIAGAGWVREG